MSIFKNLYFDKKNQRFAILLDESMNLIFVYWHSLKKHGIRTLEDNTFLNGIVQSDFTSINGRASKFSSIIAIDRPSYDLDEYNIIQNEKLDETVLLDLDKTKPTVFIQCRFCEIEIENTKFYNHMVFIDCIFEDNFRLINCKFSGDLWLPNCSFSKHFSLKGCYIEGDIHLESSDFKGIGGVSFRRVIAKNLYLDLGVEGGDDLFWLNEMIISGTVSIGGNFKNEVQFLGCQDKDESSGIEASLGSLCIGIELYEFESANKTSINSTFKIKEYKVIDGIHVKNVKTDDFKCIDVVASQLKLENVSVESDLMVKNSIFKGLGIFVNDSSVGRHLKIENNELSKSLCLNGSAVGEITYLENNTYDPSAIIDVRKFTSSRVLIYPSDFLTKNSTFNIFQPRKFNNLNTNSTSELGDQYCSLKNWLADSGKLELEDMAYFHMRQCYHSNVYTRFVFGIIFGWGVRLSNIAISSMIVVLLFSGVIMISDLKITFLKALSLSTQSFISSFFGKWDDYPPEGMLSGIVTFESIVGVIFITVFVGAYLRKLLR
jgi:hypothetical protein